MTDKTHVFASFSNLRSFSSGSRIAFVIETDSGIDFDLSVDIDEVPAIISYLARAAAITRRDSGAVDQEVSNPAVGLNISADPIPVYGAGFAMGPDSTQPCLVLHLAPKLNLAFAIPSNLLAQIAQRISSTALTLSAGNQGP